MCRRRFIRFPQVRRCTTSLMCECMAIHRMWFTQATRQGTSGRKCRTMERWFTVPATIIRPGSGRIGIAHLSRGATVTITVGLRGGVGAMTAALGGVVGDLDLFGGASVRHFRFFADSIIIITITMAFTEWELQAGSPGAIRALICTGITGHLIAEGAVDRWCGSVTMGALTIRERGKSPRAARRECKMYPVLRGIR